MAENWTEKSDTQLIEAILTELGRTAERAKDGLREILPELDSWFRLPHPSGNGEILTSKSASAGIDELARRAIAQRKLELRVSFSDVKAELGGGLIKRFVGEGRAVDVKQSSRLLSWTAKRAEQRCGQFTYIYPIRFTFKDEPREIDLGVVKLRWLRQFDENLWRLVKGYLKNSNDEKEREWARRQTRKALEYYKSYKWFATVTVKGCDKGRAEQAASDLLTSALDCLYFLIGRRAASRLAIGLFKISSDERALAWVNLDGHLVVQTSHGSLDVMSLRDGWSEDLERSDVVESIDLIKAALAAKSDLTLDRPLARRFLEAARWFGEGVRDTQSFSKIVKFTTAIERLVVAGKTEDISETVSTRLADITLSSDDRSDWLAKKGSIKRAYSVRSGLVHGSISPFSEEVMRSVSDVGDLAEEAMYTMIHRLQNDGLLAQNISEKQYASWFEGVRKWVETIHANNESRYSS